MHVTERFQMCSWKPPCFSLFYRLTVFDENSLNGPPSLKYRIVFLLFNTTPKSHSDEMLNKKDCCNGLRSAYYDVSELI